MRLRFRFLNQRSSARRYAQVLGEIHAVNQLIAHYLAIKLTIDHTVDWWGWAEVCETIKQLNTQLAELESGAAKIKPEGWHAVE